MIQFHSFPEPMPPDPQYSRPRRWSSCALSRLTRVFNPPVTMYLHCKLQLLSAEPVEAPPVPPVGKQGASHLYLGEATNSLAPALTVANVWSIHHTSTYNHHSSHTHTQVSIYRIYMPKFSTVWRRHLKLIDSPLTSQKAQERHIKILLPVLI